MELNNKLIGVVGLQRTGTATVRALLQRGARVLATDAMPLGELPEFALFLQSQPKGDALQLKVGSEAYVGLDECDMIVISPGVPITIEPLQQARDRGVEVIGEVELAFRLCPSASIIAVTGTKGKSTTTSLIGAMLEKSRIPTVVAGNIGDPFIAQLDRIAAQHRVVLEVSSFQLESTAHFHPHIAVLLNVHSDHLDRHTSLQEYIEAKMKVFANQTIDDWAVLNADQPSIIDDVVVYSQHRFFSTKGNSAHSRLENGHLVLESERKRVPFAHRDELQLRGEHNIANVLAAALAASLAGASVDAIGQAAREFRALPHRLEFVAEIGGIQFFNDSQATTPAATIAALNSFDVPIVLIAGGRAKVDDFDALGEAIARRARALIVIGEHANRIESAAASYCFHAIQHASSLQEAVNLAMKVCPSSGAVVLSPACASFDMFNSYQERGQVFRDAVKQLKARA